MSKEVESVPVSQLLYWEKPSYPYAMVMFRCPACGSVGERGSVCPGHSTPDADPFPEGLTRRPVEIPMPGDKAVSDE